MSTQIVSMSLGGYIQPIQKYQQIKASSPEPFATSVVASMQVVTRTHKSNTDPDSRLGKFIDIWV